MTLRALNRPIVDVVNRHLIEYPTPANLSYFWGYGSMAGIFLGLQIVTGILLAMHYTPHVDLAFNSVEHIMRDVNGGWLLRYLHANGASLFFFVVYIHIGRGLYYGSYAAPRHILWIIGVVIIILMMATAFMGYVLPWGQMSFWAATVITNLFSAIPVVGPSIVEWLWGGFSVDNATLNRFFSLHYLLPFILAGAVIAHLVSLHEVGSNNPLGISALSDKIAFHPYLWIKDVFGWLLIGFVYLAFVFYSPNTLGHPDNYVEGNPMVTPAHIVPEWYFLPYYAVLRSIPDKLLGVVAFGGSLAVWLILPFLHTSNVRSSLFRPLFRIFYWMFILDFIILGWIGGNLAESPYLEIGQLATVYYFLFPLVIIPGLGILENKMLEWTAPVNTSAV
jgi:quinol-cytochrome oxidoreductase complex cytochrome b subunit